MGLVVKFKKKHLKNWDLFLNRSIELYREGSTIALPFGKGGYGIIGDITSNQALLYFQKMLSEKPLNELICLVNSIDIINDVCIESQNVHKIISNYWPGDLIINIPLKPENEFSKKEYLKTLLKFLDEFNIKSINFLFPQNLLYNEFQKKMSNGVKSPKYQFGFFLKSDLNQYFTDTTTLLEMYDCAGIGMILDFGSLQKKKNLLSPTIVKINHDNAVEIIQEGIISEKDIVQNISNKI